MHTKPSKWLPDKSWAQLSRSDAQIIAQISAGSNQKYAVYLLHICSVAEVVIRSGIQHNGQDLMQPCEWLRDAAEHKTSPCKIFFK